MLEKIIGFMFDKKSLTKNCITYIRADSNEYKISELKMKKVDPIDVENRGKIYNALFSAYNQR